MGFIKWLFSFFSDEDNKELDIKKTGNGVSLDVDYSESIDLTSFKTNKGEKEAFYDYEGNELKTSKEIWDWYENADHDKYKIKRKRTKETNSDHLQLIYNNEPIIVAIYYYQTWDWILYRIEKMYLDQKTNDICLKGTNLESSKTKTIYISNILDFKLYDKNKQSYSFFINFLEENNLIFKDPLSAHKISFDKIYKSYFNIQLPQDTKISFDFQDTIQKENDIYIESSNRPTNKKVSKAFTYNGKYYIIISYPSNELFFVPHIRRYVKGWRTEINRPWKRIVPVVNMAHIKLLKGGEFFNIGQQFIDNYLSKLPKSEKLKGYVKRNNGSLYTKRKRSFLPFEEARLFIHSIHLKKRKDWDDYCAGRNPEFGIKPENIPSNPHKKYKEDWLGWKDWLGTE